MIFEIKAGLRVWGRRGELSGTEPMACKADHRGELPQAWQICILNLTIVLGGLIMGVCMIQSCTAASDRRQRGGAFIQGCECDKIEVRFAR